jgi:hypothetical protein
MDEMLDFVAQSILGQKLGHECILQSTHTLQVPL